MPWSDLYVERITLVDLVGIDLESGEVRIEARTVRKLLYSEVCSGDGQQARLNTPVLDVFLNCQFS